MLFATPEEQCCLHCLTGSPLPSTQAVDWEKWLAYYPVTYLHPMLSRLPIPDQAAEKIQALVMQCLQKNQRRLGLIRQIAAAAHSHDIPVLFVKGAAEIAEHAGNSTYMSSRSMGDIDLICRRDDIARMHDLLVRQGHRFYDYGLAAVFRSESGLQQYLLKKTGNLVYNFHSPTDTIDLHCNPTHDSDLRNYPPDFTQQLWKDARSIASGQATVRVPAHEHMLAYALCHAASPKNNPFFTDFPLRGRGEKAQAYVHFNLGRYQIKLLCQMKLLLEHYRVDFHKLRALLAGIENPLLKDDIALASYYLDAFEWEQDVTADTLHAARERFIRRHYLQEYLRFTLIQILKRHFRAGRRDALNRLLLRLCGRFI